jgi:chromosomal replication initiator protein
MSSNIIKSTVADYFNISVDKIESRNRKKEFVKARHLAMDCFLLLTDLSLSKIGNEFGRRDHATIIFACKSVNNQAYYYSDYRHELKDILSKLGFYETEFSNFENYDTDLT